MGNGHQIETKRDRKALARDAGLGHISGISVLAGALCGLSSLAAMLAFAAAIGVGIHGGADFGTTSDGRLKAVAGPVFVLSALLSFVFGGYVAGRMSRRRGAGTGLMAGVVGVALGIGVGLALKLAGGDIALGRMAARDIHVAITWPGWRLFSVLAGLAVAAAMVVGGLLGGAKGERWHGKLLARALDPSIGSEAVAREAAQRRAAEAEMSRLGSTRRVAQVTAVNNRNRPQPAAAPPAVDTTVDTAVDPDVDTETPAPGPETVVDEPKHR